MTTKIEIGGPGWQQAHLELYLKTDGAEGHLLDFSKAGGPAETPCLILKTSGRHSGKPNMTPLIYGKDGQHFVIVASRGGAPEHPAWYLNLEASPEVSFQVIDKKYRGLATSVDDPERERLYAMMAKIYPPYIDYQAKTDRKIPVILLEPTEEIERL
jgi:deazaflavin-dependent oxidoreductase (nitroreductase family)